MVTYQSRMQGLSRERALPVGDIEPTISAQERSRPGNRVSTDLGPH